MQLDRVRRLDAGRRRSVSHLGVADQSVVRSASSVITVGLVSSAVCCATP
jgi:hypothetical protein